MTTQATHLCLPLTYPTLITAKPLKQPTTGLQNDAILECNAASTPYIRACRSSEKRWEEDRDYPGSLA